MVPGAALDLSGERFSAVYRLVGDEAEARQKAQIITVEHRQALARIENKRDARLGELPRVVDHALPALTAPGMRPVSAMTVQFISGKQTHLGHFSK